VGAEGGQPDRGGLADAAGDKDGLAGHPVGDLGTVGFFLALGRRAPSSGAPARRLWSADDQDHTDPNADRGSGVDAANPITTNA
jgi:hypothetical protein